jgi:hypothetical protein
VIDARPVSDESRIVRSAAVLVLLIAAFGMMGRWQIIETGLARPGSSNIYFRLFALFELPYLVILAVFAVATWILLVVRSRRAAIVDGAVAPLAPPSRRDVSVVALAVLLIGIITTYLVMHRLLFSMDEFGADFQARIFARGEYAPVLPSPWRSIGSAMAPIFVTFTAASGRWVSQYLPVYALLKAPFIALGVDGMLNPLLSAASIVVLAAITRRLWPDDGTRQWVAIALLATSSQLVITSGTGYAMPAHLLLNLLWLLLYLRGDTRSWVAALVIGVLALGLHNPFPHALFVAPFMLRLLRERRWSRLASAAMVYLFGAAVWLVWLRYVNPATGAADTGLLHLFTFPGRSALWLHGLNVSLLLTWHAPVLGVLVIAALARLRRLDDVLVDLALGVLFTIVFFMFYPSTQGHGWGHRYAYQVIGNLCLLAAAAVPMVRSVFGERDTRRWIGAALVVALVVQIPTRLVETERFIRPFAAGYEYVRTRDARVVIVHGDALWYGRDLVRNDPFLRGPIVVKASLLGPGSVEAMSRAFPGRVLDLSDSSLLRLGMTPWAHHE